MLAVNIVYKLICFFISVILYSHDTYQIKF